MTINGIAYRLRALGIPTPSGTGQWTKQSVYRLLTQQAYTGVTYAFRETRIEKRKISNPSEVWIEVPNGTEAIIAKELFEATQEKLNRNKKLSYRNAKRNYLLSRYIFCGQCGRRYHGVTKTLSENGNIYSNSYYRFIAAPGEIRQCV
jgi:hypothetical protein